MEQLTKRKTDTRSLVRAGILSALIIVMTIVPYTGYINYGLVEITTLHIVVAVGAVMLGWQYGAVLGFVWGITCVLRALTNPLWAPFVNPMVSLVPRIVVGIVGGLTAQGLRKLRLRSGLVAALSALTGSPATIAARISACWRQIVAGGDHGQVRDCNQFHLCRPASKPPASRTPS